MNVYLDANPDDAPCCIKIVAEDGRDVLIQVDYDYPGIASTFGWNMREVQVQNAGYYGVPCDHSGTDGTIDCPDCGIKAGTFISAASEWISDHDGASAEDPGYFAED